MGIVEGLWLLFVAATVVYAATRGPRAASDRTADAARGYTTSSDGAAERLAGLLSTWTGRKCQVDPYWLGRMAPAALNEELGLRLATDGLCDTVTLCRPGFPAPAGLASSVPIGDRDLELVVNASGPHADVHALLTASTRKAIRDLVRGSVRVGQLQLEGGRLSLAVPTGGFARPHPGLETVARAFAALAPELEPVANLAERLRENLAGDPLPAVRLQNLRALVEEFGDRPETRVAVVDALGDADATVRLEAAIAARAQGRGTLVTLAADTTVAPDLSIRALDALGPNLPLDRVEALVDEAVVEPLATSPRSGRVQAFIAALARQQGSDVLRLLERLAAEVHDSYGPSIVGAIAAGQRPGAEDALIRVLVGSGPLTFAIGRPRTQNAVIDALGEIGTLESVAPLRAAAQRYGGSTAAGARRALAAVQERLAGSRGRLALTDAEAGRLSDATDATGHLTLPDEEG
jgi:hypothetical protein